MKRYICFCINGKPMNKERPRANYDTRTVYTPAKTKRNEWIVAYKLLAAMKARGIDKIEDEGMGISVVITSMFPVPKNTSKSVCKQMVDGYIRPTKKPDVDNIAKVILDGINLSKKWIDDSRVTSLTIKKAYTALHERTLVSIWW